MCSIGILHIEIEVNVDCNLRCKYCPVSKYPPEEDQYMTYELFNHVLNELKKIDFKGMLTFHRYNEPTLRDDLDTLVELAKRKLPDAELVLYSNGTLLEDGRTQHLFSSGISQMVVTDHSGIGFEPHPKIILKQPEDLEISSRAGWLSAVEKPLKLPCYAPSEMLIIGYTGEVYLCVQDYGREYVMGDISKQSIPEIWGSRNFKKYRELLKTGSREEACLLCSRCDGSDYVKARTV